MFTAYREHARFCSARCRVTSNRRMLESGVTRNSLQDASLVELIDELRERLTAMPPDDGSPAVARHHELARLLMDGWIAYYTNGRAVCIEPYGDGS
jgi:hypothetical protein